MEVQELLSGARDVMSVKRVYGDPYEKNGLHGDSGGDGPRRRRGRRGRRGQR